MGHKAKCIAVFGTGSDVGKSIVTTALCRYFFKQGYRVAPYKAQNMSNNSGITPEGLEMGRAQIVQAEAAGIAPHVDMNPILLKPTSDVGSQVILLGNVYENSTAADYHKKKETLFNEAAAALDRLRQDNDIVVMEGAGSCAEVNLMPHDIVNFRMADYADAQVVLVADIHRGGVFGQLVGTMECLPEKYCTMISGFVINRFRGDISLFQDGKEWIEQKTGKSVFGVLPWYDHINIEAEDSVVIEKPSPVRPETNGKPSVAVIRIPHISNFTDIDPLKNVTGLNTFFVEHVIPLETINAVIIPGSKNTRHDLEWLKQTGWAEAIQNYADSGGHVFGICGGYQMLGNYLHDPSGHEGVPGSSEGLGLLPVETTMKSPKTTTLSTFSWDGAEGAGYEIHMGHTQRTGGRPLLQVSSRNQYVCDMEEGCTSDSLSVMGTYMHGFFDVPGITGKWLRSIGLNGIHVPELSGLAAREREYDLLLEHVEDHIDLAGITNGTGCL